MSGACKTVHGCACYDGQYIYMYNMHSTAHALHGIINALFSSVAQVYVASNFFCFVKILYLQWFRDFMEGQDEITTNTADDHKTPSGSFRSPG